MAGGRGGEPDQRGNPASPPAGFEPPPQRRQGVSQESRRENNRQLAKNIVGYGD